MNRDTSIEIYNRLVKDGTLSRKRLEVTKFIAYNGPTYQRKAHKELTKGSQLNSSTYMSRFKELEISGVIAKIGLTVDEDTGNNVYLYDLTGNMPNIVKPMTNTEKIKILVKAIKNVTENRHISAIAVYETIDHLEQALKEVGELE